jgi:hypothetical protein
MSTDVTLQAIVLRRQDIGNTMPGWCYCPGNGAN